MDADVGAGVAIRGGAVSVGSEEGVGAGGAGAAVEVEVKTGVGASRAAVGRGVAVTCPAMGWGEGVEPQAASRAASRSSRIPVRRVFIDASPF